MVDELGRLLPWGFLAAAPIHFATHAPSVRVRVIASNGFDVATTEAELDPELFRRQDGAETE